MMKMVLTRLPSSSGSVCVDIPLDPLSVNCCCAAQAEGGIEKMMGGFIGGEGGRVRVDGSLVVEEEAKDSAKGLSKDWPKEVDRKCLQSFQ